MVSPRIAYHPSPHVPFMPALDSVKEQRGWRHFFRQVVPILVALVVGAALGFSCACVYFTRLPQHALQQQGPYYIAPPPIKVPEEYFYQKPLNNSCLIPQMALPSGKPQTFDACAFVVESTDAVWNNRGDVTGAIEKYFHEEYVDAGSWGKRIIGKAALKDAVLSEMRAFPDIQIHITDCLCRGNDEDGYKCAMPDVLTGTNMGPSGYGPPTGRSAKWTGMVESLVKQNPKTGQWQYYAEWGVHDEWSLIQQLGLDFNRVPHGSYNMEPMHDCTPLVQFPSGGGTAIDKADVAWQNLHVAESSWQAPGRFLSAEAPNKVTQT